MNEVLRGSRLGGHDPSELAERFGTPFYAYDLDVVTRQVEALRSILPATFDLAYAVKANPNLAVLRHLAGLGLGADVASGGELRQSSARASLPNARAHRPRQARRGADGGRRGGGPGRHGGVTGELRRLARIAEGLGRRQPMLLRAAVTNRPLRVGPAPARASRASSAWMPWTCARRRPRRSPPHGCSRSASTHSACPT